MTDFNDAQVTIQGYYVDGHVHPERVYARGGNDPETTACRQRARSNQSQKARNKRVSYRYLVSDSGSLRLIYS